MSRSFTHLRRALFGVSCAIVFGVGATAAAAKPEMRDSAAKCPIGTTMCPNGYCAGPNERCFTPLEP